MPNNLTNKTFGKENSTRWDKKNESWLLMNAVIFVLGLLFCSSRINYRFMLHIFVPFESYLCEQQTIIRYFFFTLCNWGAKEKDTACSVLLMTCLYSKNLFSSTYYYTGRYSQNFCRSLDLYQNWINKNSRTRVLITGSETTTAKWWIKNTPNRRKTVSNSRRLFGTKHYPWAPFSLDRQMNKLVASSSLSLKGPSDRWHVASDFSSRFGILVSVKNRFSSNLLIICIWIG